MTNTTDRHGVTGTPIGALQAMDLTAGDVLFLFGEFVSITSTYQRGDDLEIEADNVCGFLVHSYTANPNTVLTRYTVRR